MKVSDYIIQFIEKKGISDIFLLPGGGMMHLLDSLAKNASLQKYCNLNEQATTIAAEGYAAYTTQPGVAFLTTGPGSTNAVTGVADAYIDSTPLFIISGQAKTADLMTGKGVRQIGAQEVNIVDIVKPITNYAVTITDANKIRYHLEKAWFLATTGRRGPVWLDIPLDIQSAQISEEQLSGYSPDISHIASSVPVQDIHDIYQLLNQAQRPVILFGYGVVSGGATELFTELISTLNIPVLSSWRVKDLLVNKYNNYYGSPGSLAPRYSNFIVQNSDLLLVIGARLNFCMTAFNETGFAPNAKKIVVDIDPNELALLQGQYEKKLVIDAKSFLHQMLEFEALYDPADQGNWLSYCKNIKQEFPLSAEKQPHVSSHVDGYHLGFTIARLLKAGDVIVSASSGRASAIAPMTIGGNVPNRFITAMGLGSMGYGLPLSIGACVASGKRRTICIEGDGSLQHNLQELQLISTYQLPLKLFILNNNGYASIYGMQRNHFQSRFLDCTPDSGLRLPPIQPLAELYDIPYRIIRHESEMPDVLEQIMANDLPCLCEVMIDIDFEEIPRAATKLDENGKPYSAPLDDLYPFLTESQKQHTKL